MYDSRRARGEAKALTRGTGSQKVLLHPDRGRLLAAFYAGRAKGVTLRALRLIELYLRVGIENGVPLLASGIRLSDGKYLIPDRAVMKTALNEKWMTLTGGVFS
jgi:hypothetical protein